MGDIFDDIKPDAKSSKPATQEDIFDRVKPTVSGAHQAGVAAVKSTWADRYQKFKEHPVKETGKAIGNMLGLDVIPEAGRLLTEAAVAPFSAINKLGSGIGAATGTLAGGGSLADAARSRREAAQKATLQSPFGPSRTSKAVGGLMSNPLEGGGAITDTINDITDVGGDVAALLSVKPTVNALGSAVKKSTNRLATEGLPFTDKRAKFNAAQQYDAAAAPVSPQAGRLHARNQQQATNLENRLSPNGPKFPTAAAQGNRPLAGLQKSQANTHPAFLKDLEGTEAELIDSARKRAETVGPANAPNIQTRIAEEAAKREEAATGSQRQLEGVTGVLEQAPAPQTVGEQLTGALREAEAPLAERTSKLYNELPDYEVHGAAWKPVDDAIQATRSAHLADSQRQLVDEQIRYVGGLSKNTAGLEMADKSLGEAAYAARKANNNAAARFINDLQKGVRQAADELGTAADKGDIALAPAGQPGGKPQLVQPSVIEAEVKRMEADLKKATTAPASLPVANDHLYMWLKEHGGEPPMKVVGISDKEFGQILDQRLKQSGLKGYEPPTSAAVNPETIANLQQGIAQRRQLLDNLQPAENFATAYKAARASAKEQADRFKKGAVADALRTGDEITGGRMQSEDVSRKFADASGADDLIRAVGPEKAAEMMKNHFAREAAGKLTGAPRQIADWVSRNRDVLKKYGMYDDFANLQRIRETVAATQEDLTAFNKSTVGKVLAVPQDKIIPTIMDMPNPARAIRELKEFGGNNRQFNDGIKGLLRDHMKQSLELAEEDALGNPKLSFAKAKKMARQYNEVIKEVYSPAEQAKLRDLYSTLQNIQRARNVRAYGGGSDTAGNLTGNLQARVAYGVARDGVTAIAGGGVVNAGAHIISAITKMASKSQSANITRFVEEALLDPAKADVLLKIAKGGRSKDVVGQLNAYLKSAATRGGVAAAGQAASKEDAGAVSE